VCDCRCIRNDRCTTTPKVLRLSLIEATVVAGGANEKALTGALLMFARKAI